MKANIQYSNRFRILKNGKINLIVSALLGSATVSFASPSGGVVTSGSATISQNAKVTNINQSTQKASINWQKFGIKADETVNFNQPNVNSITLNRVVGNEKSIINGALNANGQVWILNSNGVLFNSTAKINTSGLLATTKDISDTNFQNGNYSFTGNSTNSVINQGSITVKNDGYVVLASNEVVNSGTIEAIKGKVHLTGANEYTLNLNGNSLVDLTVDRGVFDALVKNSGTIISDGGEIYLTTNAVNELLKGVVNNTGIIEANSLDGVIGKVELFAHGGEAQIAGTIKAKDGFVETSGKEFTLLDEATIQTAHWLIDPVDITIDSTLASTIETALGTGDVTIETTTSGASTVDTSGSESGTAGDIYVNSSIAWNSNILTLKADNDININSQLDLTNTAGLFLQYAQTTNTGTYNVNAPVNIASTGSFSTQHASDALVNWSIVNDISAVQNIGTDTTTLAGNYVLGSDISASSIANFAPIGNHITAFTGNFDGLGHTISDLTINRPAENNIGFFGEASASSVIKNIGLVDADVTGYWNVGGLVGYSYGTISNAYATGSVSGDDKVGGLAGYSDGTIINVYATESVSGNSNVGGLAGYNNTIGTITNAYATGSVTGSNAAGGLVGSNVGTITNAYATGSVDGYMYVGGLVGQSIGNITNTYATGNVNGSFYVGGLVGYGASSNSFWDIDTTGQTYNGLGGTGLTTEQFADASNFSAWSSNSAWELDGAGSTVEGYEVALRPYLKDVTRVQDRESYTLFESGYGDSSNPYTITNWEQLQNINFNSDTLTNNYYYNLSNDLSSTTTGYDTYASSTANSNAGWNSIGNNSTRFTGNFDGLGHTISDLTINRAAEDYVGLFGYANTGSMIKNIVLVGGSVSGGSNVGGVVGINDGSITNVYTTGSVSGINLYVGGVVGINNGTITNVYATGSVSGTSTAIGGLVGQNGGSIINAYATGSVSGANNVGGLVGQNGGSITNAYATGSVNGTINVGGLVGQNNMAGTVTKTYATGSVNGTTNVGGLFGFILSGSIINSFWDKLTTGQTAYTGGGSGTVTDISSAPYDIATYNDPTTGFGTDIEEDTTLSSSYKYPVLSVFNGGGSTTWKIYKAPAVVTPTTQTNTSTQTDETSTQTEINKVITAIVNKNVLTNKDLNTLMNSGIDISSFINQVKLAGGNLVIIPGVVLKMLNGGINLPYGMDRQFSLDSSTNNKDEKEEENI